ncbi:MAG: hydroxymethylglutaryl-CoA lyase [Cytophagales bacterium]|nr:hydroxymethylglutaryl-CoA lyase [Cytophagales bacterium]MCA6382912.1 hydroxymethylglutaryl-CoA lyase [Cytophagales bacterium]
MKIIECPRDAMQGLSVFIPTERKVAYLSQLLKIGFDTVDFGSFVSPKAIPQLRDTAEVLSKLDLTNTKSKLLAIVANTRGAREAAEYQSISYLGFPLSISETFQRRNTNKSIADALLTVQEIQEICIWKNKELVTYISMGFGNPYGDPYDTGIVEQFSELLNAMNVRIISLADTIGVSKPDQIQMLFGGLTKKYPKIEFGVHLHSNPATAIEKIAAAYASGCQRFDGAIKGFGGCPMADDELIGNLATETILSFLDSKQDAPSIDRLAFNEALLLADTIFPH